MVARKREKEDDGEANGQPQSRFPQASDARDEERLGRAGGLRSAQVLPEYVNLRR
jgi:hypothetical protein